jgi:hypothetical protein
MVAGKFLNAWELGKTGRERERVLNDMTRGRERERERGLRESSNLEERTEENDGDR